jgi:hypothetical protein
MNDKPSIVARDAQAATAKATAAIEALPPSAARNNLLKVLTTVGGVASIVAAAATGGVSAAIEVGVPVVVGIVSAWYHPTPTAVTAFGANAK